MRRPYRDRFHAGQLLAMELAHYADRPDVLVLGIARGGVAVGYELARALQVPLDVFVVSDSVTAEEGGPVRLGTIATGGAVQLDCDASGFAGAALEQAVARGRENLERLERLYRGGRPAHDIAARTVVLVDDHLCGSSVLRDAVSAVRRLRPLRLVVAVAAACTHRSAELRESVDDLVCLVTSRSDELETWYDELGPIADDQVRELLDLSEELSDVA